MRCFPFVKRVAKGLMSVSQTRGDSSFRHSLVLAFAASLFGFAGGSRAAIFSYAPPPLVGSSVTYPSVSESSDTSSTPLYGAGGLGKQFDFQQSQFCGHFDERIAVAGFCRRPDQFHAASRSGIVSADAGSDGIRGLQRLGDAFKSHGGRLLRRHSRTRCRSRCLR